MKKNILHNKTDLRPALNKAIINYRQRTNRDFIQADIDPTVNASHINNVASGISGNKNLRKKIETFIEKYGSK